MDRLAMVQYGRHDQPDQASQADRHGSSSADKSRRRSAQRGQPSGGKDAAGQVGCHGPVRLTAPGFEAEAEKEQEHRCRQPPEIPRSRIAAAERVPVNHGKQPGDEPVDHHHGRLRAKIVHRPQPTNAVTAGTDCGFVTHGQPGQAKDMQKRNPVML